MLSSGRRAGAHDGTSGEPFIVAAALPSTKSLLWGPWGSLNVTNECRRP